MPVQATSTEAYRDLAPTINKRQAAVLDIITRFGPITNLGIQRRLGWPINQITGRTNELVGKGLVAESHRAPDPVSKRRGIWWKAVQPA